MIFSHLKTTSYPVIFYCKGKKLVKVKKIQFHPWHYENGKLQTPSSSHCWGCGGFCTECLLTISDAGSKGKALQVVLELEFPHLISGMEKGNVVKIIFWKRC